MAPVIDITITRGKTYEYGYLYADESLTYKPITAMPSTAPVQLTVTDHGLPDGWLTQVQCVKAPVELNSDPDGDEPYYYPRVIDENTIELNGFNAHCLKAFSGSGLIIFPTPVDLTGWSCRAQIRDRVGGEILFSWSSDAAVLPDGLIVVDTNLSAFIFNIDAVSTAALSFKSGVYDAEAIAPGGEVYPLVAISSVVVADEVTA